jgi:hypothetical protein
MKRASWGLGVRWVAVGLLAALLGSPGDADAQNAPPAGAPPAARADSVELLFEREVFRYPRGNRRNPFLPLTGEDAGPRVEDLVLTGVILAEAPGASIALLGPRTPTGTAARGATRTPAPSLRVREGDVLGSLKILAIEPRRVLIEVDEFGVREIRVLELRRPGVEVEESPEPPPPAPPPSSPDPALPPGGDVPSDTTRTPGSNPVRDARDGDKQ